MSCARWGFILTLGLVLLTGCASRPAGGDGPPASPQHDPWAAPEPTPAALPRSRYGNPDQYEVFGKRYYLRSESRGFVQEGLASWYGQKFHGRRTSSGEPFDMYALTAAHKELPIPCIARVTNLRNGRSLLLRINDRGPFHADRILDLSWAAAVRLDVIPYGTAPIRLEVVERATPSARAPSPMPRAQTPAVQGWDPFASPRANPQESVFHPAAYYLQVGAFRTDDGARQRQQQMRALGYPVTAQPAPTDGWHRVWLGPWPDALAAEQAAADLNRQRIPSLLIAQ